MWRWKPSVWRGYTGNNGSGGRSWRPADGSMSLKTFKAASMADCLTLVKTELGSDAVILHTRKIAHRRWLGLRRVEIVEITAGRGVA